MWMLTRSKHGRNERRWIMWHPLQLQVQQMLHFTNNMSNRFAIPAWFTGASQSCLEPCNHVSGICMRGVHPLCTLVTALLNSLANAQEEKAVDLNVQRPQWKIKCCWRMYSDYIQDIGYWQHSVERTAILIQFYWLQGCVKSSYLNTYKYI